MQWRATVDLPQVLLRKPDQLGTVNPRGLELTKGEKNF